MDVVPENVHSEELAPADLAGVLLVTVGQQVLVHVAPAREHLGTGNQYRRAAYRTYTRADPYSPQHNLLPSLEYVASSRLRVI